MIIKTLLKIKNKKEITPDDIAIKDHIKDIKKNYNFYEKSRDLYIKFY